MDGGHRWYSPTGIILLIPQGARLIGQYDAQVAFGYAGLSDEVNSHWGLLFKAAILSTLLERDRFMLNQPWFNLKRESPSQVKLEPDQLKLGCILHGGYSLRILFG